MKLFVGVTTDQWFRFRSERSPLAFLAFFRGDQFENGRHYYALHGQSLSLPRHESDRPAREFLEWHNSIFRG